MSLINKITDKLRPSEGAAPATRGRIGVEQGEPTPNRGKVAGSEPEAVCKVKVIRADGSTEELEVPATVSEA